MKLAQHANNILGLFGNLPECLLDLEDAANAFLRARKFYWQQIGISSMDLKVQNAMIDLTPEVRDFALTASSGADLSQVFPDFVELELNNANRRRIPVDVVPLEDVIRHEGERALAIYGNPNRVRLAWDAWTDGTLYFFYDPTAGIQNLTLDTEIDFPESFLEMVEYKAVWNLVSLAQSREAREAYDRQRPLNAYLIDSLKSLKIDFAVSVTEWENEFKIWRFSANEERSYERRSDAEIPTTRGDNFYEDDWYRS